MRVEFESGTRRVGASKASQPCAHLGDRRWYVSLLLGLVLVFSEDKPIRSRFVGPTAAGYVFALSVSPSLIFRGDAAELIVSVRNAQGQPVDDLPVTFQVGPAWAQSASVSPEVASTKQGMARALFQASTTGVVRVTVRVDNVTQESRITVVSRPSSPNE